MGRRGKAMQPSQRILLECYLVHGCDLLNCNSRPLATVNFFALIKIKFNFLCFSLLPNHSNRYCHPLGR